MAFGTPFINFNTYKDHTLAFPLYQGVMEAVLELSLIPASWSITAFYLKYCQTGQTGVGLCTDFQQMVEWNDSKTTYGHNRNSIKHVPFMQRPLTAITGIPLNNFPLCKDHLQSQQEFY